MWGVGNEDKNKHINFYMEYIDKRIDEYSGLFDLYIDGKPTPPEYKDDPVARYIEETCWRN